MLSGLDANEAPLSTISRQFMLLAPDMYSRERTVAMRKLSAPTKVADKFRLITEKVADINESVVEYDLTDALSHFLEKQDMTDKIGSPKKIAKPGDLVVSRMTSDLKEMAIVPSRPFPQLFSSEFFVLRPESASISPQTLMAFLLGPFPQAILDRSQYGVRQSRFYQFALTDMPIPDAVIAINQAVTERMKMAEQFRNNSGKLLHKSDASLLHEFGLTNWQPSGKNWGIKRFSETFVALNRIDAQYHSPVLDEMRKVIRKQGIQFQSAGDVFSVHTDKIAPNQQREYCYIELSNVGNFGNILSHTRHLGADLPTRARQIVYAGNVIIPTVEGSMSACALIGREHDGFLCSTGFFVLTPRNISPEVAFLLFKNQYLQEAMKRAASGTILTSVNSEMFRTIPVPIPSQKLQAQIKSDVKKAFAARLESERLMNAAVRAVECAVEKGEKAGLKMLEKLTA